MRRDASRLLASLAPGILEGCPEHGVADGVDEALNAGRQQVNSVDSPGASD